VPRRPEDKGSRSIQRLGQTGVALRSARLNALLVTQSPWSLTCDFTSHDAPRPLLLHALLLVALGPAAKAANTVFSTDIVDGKVKTADLANAAVTFTKLAPNAVRSENVLANSLTAADIKGADVKGAISVPTGYVPNGRCRHLVISAPGAAPREALSFQ
jgi:hypothetical protein